MERESPEETKLKILTEAYLLRGMTYENIKPEMQLPQWMTIGLMRFGRGKKITLTDIEEMEGAGGTREPDPWVGPYR